jgi:hypothetical protein
VVGADAEGKADDCRSEEGAEGDVWVERHGACVQKLSRGGLCECRLLACLDGNVLWYMISGGMNWVVGCSGAVMEERDSEREGRYYHCGIFGCVCGVFKLKEKVYQS